MNNIQTKIKEWLSCFADWIEYKLRCLYGETTLMKQFIIVLIIGGFLSVFSICTLVGSIYNMGKNDAGQKFMELQHIETLQLQQKKDSINLLKQKMYEYEQSIE